jgi:hypothetical protein
MSDYHMNGWSAELDRQDAMKQEAYNMSNFFKELAEQLQERVKELEADAENLRNTITSCQITIKEQDAVIKWVRETDPDGYEKFIARTEDYS